MNARITRRGALQGGAAVAASLLCRGAAGAEAKARSVSLGSELPLFGPMAKPSVEEMACHRLMFGPRAEDPGRVRELGLERFVEEQLSPTSVDPLLAEKLESARLHIEYGEEELEGDGGKKYKVGPLKEDRPLQYLTAKNEELWKLRDYGNPRPWAEKERPFAEVRVASFLRAVYSKWQLQEVLVDFWHNHFTVNGYVDHDGARVTWPIYDRDVIRKHAMGNFREFLEAVAKSPPMLIYLNNQSSKASPANENFARELFELHTLGERSYLNHLYNRWRDVPGALKGKPQGYIDQDVYEAARCFTGWTLADGAWGRDEALPSTGEFLYYEGFHDPYQKRVLGVEIEAHQPPMADGLAVLDLLANHPGTARHICTKLVQRLVSDNPPDSLVSRAEKVWSASTKKPDQIARTVREIVLSPEFGQVWGEKMKRPFESLVALLRAIDAEVHANAGLVWWCEAQGQRVYSFPTPNGNPDQAAAYLGSSSLISRWNIAQAAIFWDNDMIKVATDKLPLALQAKSYREVASGIAERLLGRKPEASALDAYESYLRGASQEFSSVDEPELRNRAKGLIALVAMSPEFVAR